MSAHGALSLRVGGCGLGALFGGAGADGYTLELRSPANANEFRPDQVPITWPEIPAPNLLVALALDGDTQRRTGFTAILSSTELRKVDPLDAELRRKSCNAATRQGVGV